MIKCWNFFQEKNYSKTGFTRRLNWYDSSIYIKTRIIKFWLSRSNSFMDSITTHCYARWNAKIIKFWFKFLRRKKIRFTLNWQLLLLSYVTKHDTIIIKFWQIVPIWIWIRRRNYSLKRSTRFFDELSSPVRKLILHVGRIGNGSRIVASSTS